MSAPTPAHPLTPASTDQPTPRLDSTVQAYLETGLDRIMRAWSDGDDVSVETLATERPDLRTEIEALFDLVREVALLRPESLPRVPGYDVLREIGRGGMGIVYAARQHGLDRLVALKLLPSAIATSDTSRRRFLAEAKSLARIRHAHVVTIHDVVEAGELCAYAMEWVDGRSLADLLEDLRGWNRRGPAPTVPFGAAGSAGLPDDSIVWFCRIGIAIARALGEVHRIGLVHRDVKPSNILLRGDGTPLLADFGVVRDEHLGLTRSGQVVGTPAYAPPEQLRGELEDVGPTADVFSLGATLHQVFAGVVPFAGRGPADLVTRIEARARRPLTALGLPRDLETIVGKCLEPRGADRYASADALADDLENLLALRPIAARPLGVLPRTVRLMRRNKRAVAGAVAGGLVVLIASALLAWALYQRAILPAQVAGELRRAQWALLDPLYAERIERIDRGDGRLRATRLTETTEGALAAYDRAIALMPERQSTRSEREVVVRAIRDVRAEDGLESGTGRSAERSPPPLPPHLDSDPRLRGLHAFLIGDAEECQAAWAALDLAPGSVDPLIDAAAGQMYLARGEESKAYPRLLRAFDAWPDAGFLAVAVADCAVRLVDLAKAKQYLEIAERLAQPDPFRTRELVEADLAAALGRNDQAREVYESITRTYPIARQARLHYAELLEREGEFGRAVDLMLELVERQPDRDRFRPELFRRAKRWWDSLGAGTQLQEILASWQPLEPASRLRRLSAAGSASNHELEKTRTATAASTSVDLHRRIRSQSTVPLESVLAMVRSKEAAWFRSILALGKQAAESLPTIAPRLSGRVPDRSMRCASPAALRGTLPSILGLSWILSLWAPELAGQALWTERTPTSGSPSNRADPAGAFDAASGSVLVFGGLDSAGNYLNDLWSWQGASRTWTQVAPSGPLPAPRTSRGAFTPEGNGNFILFGGNQGTTAYADTWRWDGTSWTNLLPATSPPARQVHAMAYDSARGLVVLFGGVSGGALTQLHDTWEWDGTNWTNKTLPGSSGVFATAMTYDPIRSRVIRFGGAVYGGPLNNETWEWDGTSWLQRTPVSSPSARYSHTMTWDSQRSCVALFGGSDGTHRLNDLWEWDGTNWTQVAPVQGPVPSGRSNDVFVHDDILGETVLFGGTGPASPPYFGDTWTRNASVCPAYATTGPGCAGVVGTPVLAAAPGSLPYVGGTFNAEVAPVPNALPAVTVMLLGFSAPNLPLCVIGRCECTLHSDLAVPATTLATINNRATWSVSIPNDRNLVGYSGIFTQVAVLDFPSGLDALSNGMQMTIGIH